MRTVLVVAGLSLAIGTSERSAPADDAPNRKKLAFTDRSAADDDFAFQGEYTGLALLDDVTGGERYQRVGLQVVAHGNGEFVGLQYPRGLPGAGWFGGNKTTLKGRRENERLTLTGDEFVVDIENGSLHLRSTAGNTLGRFARVERTSPTLGAPPPTGARVLFDGTGTEHFKNGKMTDDGLLKIGTEFQDTYENFTLHIEFLLPYMPYARGQGRANSGVYLQSRYEVQILDSFGLDGEFNECGALYRYRKPDVNMCLPPLQWQTYDITFFSPGFDANGNKCRNARLTVRHNGVLIHNNFDVERKTGAGRKEGPDLFPIKLQNHGNPVRFRNIWIVEHAGACRLVPSRGMVASRYFGLDGAAGYESYRRIVYAE